MIWVKMSEKKSGNANLIAMKLFQILKISYCALLKTVKLNDLEYSVLPQIL